MEVKHDEFLRPLYSGFCNKLVRYLFNKSGLGNSPVKECPFFTFEIGEAVMTISNIYQKEYRKTFSYISTSLKTRGVLEKCCMLIPVKKDGCYFFNFLKRISLIFGLARNCLVHFKDNEINEDYFEIALKCIENYPDLMYFNISGGWEGLQNTADFLAKLGLPLKLLMSFEVLQDTSIQTFSDAVEKLHKRFLYKAKTEMLDSKEVIFLDDLCKIYKANSKIVTREKRSTPCPVDNSPGAKGNLKREKEVLMEYLAKCLEEGKTRHREHEDRQPLKAKKALLYNELTNILYKATVVIKDISVLEKEESQENVEDTSERRLESFQKNSNSAAECNVHDSEENRSLYSPSLEAVDSTERNNHRESPCTKDSGLIDLKELETPAENMEVFIAVIPPLENFQCEQSCISPNTTGIAGKECEAGTQMIPTKPSVSDEPPKGTPDKVAEHISDGKEKDAQYNFIVPEKYFLTNVEGNSDECKYLYTAKINPPYKREKMTKSLKEMLDRNFDNNNYRLMPSGDYFVNPPDSTAGETLFVFVDSSTDEESDEDMNTLVCLFKKNDLEFENQKNEAHNLRPRKPAMHRRDSPRKEPKASSSKISQTQSQKSKVQSSIDNEDEATAHTKYLTSLYKKNLPVIFDYVERHRTYLSLNKTTPGNEEEYESEPEASGPSNVRRKGTLFLIDAGLLAKRKVELEGDGEYDLVLGLSESPVLIRHYNPGILPAKQDRKLNYFIKKAKYSQICSGVFIAGELSSKSEIWYLFPEMKSTQFKSEYRRDILRVAELYKNAVYSTDEFSATSREFIESVVNSIRRDYEL